MRIRRSFGATISRTPLSLPFLPELPAVEHPRRVALDALAIERRHREHDDLIAGGALVRLERRGERRARRRLQSISALSTTRPVRYGTSAARASSPRRRAPAAAARSSAASGAPHGPRSSRGASGNSLGRPRAPRNPLSTSSVSIAARPFAQRGSGALARHAGGAIRSIAARHSVGAHAPSKPAVGDDLELALEQADQQQHAGALVRWRKPRGAETFRGRSGGPRNRGAAARRKSRASRGTKTVNRARRGARSEHRHDVRERRSRRRPVRRSTSASDQDSGGERRRPARRPSRESADSGSTSRVTTATISTPVRASIRATSALIASDSRCGEQGHAQLSPDGRAPSRPAGSWPSGHQPLFSQVPTLASVPGYDGASSRSRLISGSRGSRITSIVATIVCCRAPGLDVADALGGDVGDGMHWRRLRYGNTPSEIANRCGPLSTTKKSLMPAAFSSAARVSAAALFASGGSRPSNRSRSRRAAG